MDDDTANRKRTIWSEQLDQQLLQLVNTYVMNKMGGVLKDNTLSGNLSMWNEISNKIPGKNARQCRERYVFSLDPAVNKQPWTSEEDAVLLERHSMLGNRWAAIAKYLPGRTEYLVKTRHKALLRAKEGQLQTQEQNSIPISSGINISTPILKESNPLLPSPTNFIPLDFSIATSSITPPPPPPPLQLPQQDDEEFPTSASSSARRRSSSRIRKLNSSSTTTPTTTTTAKENDENINSQQILSANKKIRTDDDDESSDPFQVLIAAAETVSSKKNKKNNNPAVNNSSNDSITI